MDVILIILGILGFGAVMISTYVFTVAARTYVSEDHGGLRRNSGEARLQNSQLIPRSTTDRRAGKPVTFPLTVNGILIAKDRRTHPDRRKAN